MRQIGTGSRHFNILSGASACAQTIKLQHALELLETQTLGSLQNYIFELFDQAKQGKSKAVQQIVKQPDFNKAYIKLTELIAKKIENPKLQKLKEIVEEEIKKKKNTKIIVFAQYRDTVVKICKELNSLQNVKAKVFIGQAKKTNKDGKETGLSQREQQEIIKEFSLGMINVIAATAIGEEGLDLPEVNAVIFYEPIPSAIRQIQRRGRTARLIPGKLIILMITGTRDEGYYWAAFHKEKKMYKVLDGIKEELKNNNKKKDNEKKEKQESLF
jgi:Fanconi anemia group M protein